MRYATHDYAEALVEALGEPKADGAAIHKNFLALVRRNGDEARLKKILDEATRLARDSGGTGKGLREVMIESARSLSKSQEKLVHQFLKPGDIVDYRIKPELVAGVRITVNDEMQFDGTMKAKLDTLFS